MSNSREFVMCNVLWTDYQPTDWVIQPVWQVFKIGRGRVIAETELNPNGTYPVYSSQTKNNGCLGFIDTYDFDCTQITWTTDGANAGTVFLRRGKHNCTNVCGTLLPLKPARHDIHFYTYFLSYVTQFHKRPDTNGAKIMNGEMAAIRLAVPPVYEQRQIAAYLNRETAKIDKLIAKQQKLIKLLQEKRQAVISQTVTKGLDSNVDYEVTDRTLTGRYPRSWTLSKIGREVKIAEGQVDPKESPFDEFILIAPNHIEKSTGRILNLEKAVDQGAESGKYLCKKGEIIYSKIRPALCKVALSPVDCLCSADMYPMSSLGRVSNEFLFYFLLSDAFTKLAVLESERVAMPKINRESLTAMSIVFPSLEEQEKIVSFIESQIKHCDALINKSNQSMRLLIEHRQALITAAVTGKIDVRGLVTDEEVAALDADPVLETTEEDFESEVAEADYITEEE